MVTAAQGLVGQQQPDNSGIAYQFTLCRRENGSIFASTKSFETKSDGSKPVEHDFNPAEAMRMMREYMVFLERQLLAKQVADLVATSMIEQMQNRKILSAIQGGH